MAEPQGPNPDKTGTGAGTPAPAPTRSIRWRINRTDFIVTLVILAIVGVTYYGTTLFDPVAPKLREYMVGPEGFPRLVLGVIVFLTLWLPFEIGLRREEEGRALEKDRADTIKPITYITALVLATVVVLYTFLGTLLSIIAVCVVLPLLWGERRWKIWIPYVILMPALIVVIFAGGLQINFEPGIFDVRVRSVLF